MSGGLNLAMYPMNTSQRANKPRYLRVSAMWPMKSKPVRAVNLPGSAMADSVVINFNEKMVCYEFSIQKH